MYCKYCGNQIANDSVFCPKCGKLVVEAYPHLNNQETTSNEAQWVSTENLQWKRPIVARYVQIIFLFILGTLMLYPLYCVITGGETIQYGYSPGESYTVYVRDPWRLKILKFTSVTMSRMHRNDTGYIHRYYFGVSDAQDVFRNKMSLVFIPFFVLIGIIIWWIQTTRFPNVRDNVPRDIADEIEQYEWCGFSQHKYVFFKKDGKNGILDASKYCVKVPAQYDFIVWRMPNKTFDVKIDGKIQTVALSDFKGVSSTNAEDGEKTD